MKLEIRHKNFSIQWSGIYHLALVDYPYIKDWEIEKIQSFMAYEKRYGRETELFSKNELLRTQLEAIRALKPKQYPFRTSHQIVASTFDARGQCVDGDFLSHSCPVSVAQNIFKTNKILSATKVFNKTPKELLESPRNVAGDPEDYFNYVMLAWSNTTSGYRIAMERTLDRMPTDDELMYHFIPGVSFHFHYDDIVSLENYVFDGYHPAKVRDYINLNCMIACVIPQKEKHRFIEIIDSNILNKVYFLDYNGEGLIEWTDKVYQTVIEKNKLNNKR